MIDLKAKREEKGITQEELAIKVGVARQAISAIECGIAKPTVENAKKIAEVIGIDWTEFYETENNGNVSKRA